MDSERLPSVAVVSQLFTAIDGQMTARDLPRTAAVGGRAGLRTSDLFRVKECSCAFGTCLASRFRRLERSLSCHLVPSLTGCLLMRCGLNVASRSASTLGSRPRRGRRGSDTDDNSRTHLDLRLDLSPF